MDATASAPLSGEPDRLTVVPGSITIDGQTYHDSWDSLIHAGAREDAVWTAAVSSGPPTVDAYLQAIRQATNAGDAALCLTPAHTLSHAYAHAQAAATTLQEQGTRYPIHVMDTGLVGGAVGLVAHEALAVTPEDLSAGLQRVAQVIRRCQLYCFVEDVAPLAATGKVPQATAWLEGGTRRRTILALARGELSFLAAVPSWSRGGERLLKLIRAQSRLTPTALLVQWTEGDERAQELIAALYQGVNCSPLFAARACPSLSTVAGRGAVAVAFYPKE